MELFISAAAFYFLFTLESVSYVDEFLSEYAFIDFILCRKSLHMAFMLAYTTIYIVCNTRIKNGIALICHDINVIHLS